MKITSYQFKSTGDSEWDFSPVALGNISLLVGDSGTGKTRFLNTMFSLGAFVASNKANTGNWNLSLSIGEANYTWHIRVVMDSEEQPTIAEERLVRSDVQPEVVLVERSAETFVFCGREMPKLSPGETSIHLLQDEEAIRPLYQGFCAMLMRRFWSNDLAQSAKYQSVNTSRMNKSIWSLDKLYATNLDVSARLYLLLQNHRRIYDGICARFIETFPFVAKVGIRDIQDIEAEMRSGRIVVPAFCIRGNKVNRWIPLHHMSSGMQKILLMLVDVYIAPEGMIYLIDEYENSLGINAINVLPELLEDFGDKIQFIITSHHPYIINSIPIAHWYIFHRLGSKVTVNYGEELVERFGRSRQAAFVKLVNDPFYTDGIR